MLYSKIKVALSSLQKPKNILSHTKLYHMYKALFECHLRYSDELWGNLSNTKLQHLQRLQTNAKSLIENSRLKSGWRCNWLSFSNIVQYDRAAMIYKIVNGLCKGSLKGRLVPRSWLLLFYGERA